MKMLEILRDRLAAILDQRASAFAELEQVPEAAETESRSLTDEEAARASTLTDTIKDLDVKADETRKQIADLEEIEKRAASIPQFIKPATPAAEVDALRDSPATVRDAALRVVESAHWLDSRQQDAIDKLIRRSGSHTDGDLIARRAVATERPEYRTAFVKYVAGRGDELTAEERQAVAEYRTGMAGSLDTSGGYGVPVKVAA